MMSNLLMPNILVVDDEPTSRAALTIVLRPFGVISVATSAEDAFAVLKERTIDLVILELKQIPDRSGPAILQEIKRLSPNVDMILITARGILTSALAGLTHGAVGFLLKPFNAVELVRLAVQITQNKQVLASAG